MKINSLFQKFVRGKKAEQVAPPVLGDATRFPYGPFQFKTRLPKGTAYQIDVSADLKTWTDIANGTAGIESMEYLDSDASKFNHRFYRIAAGTVHSTNVIGYAAVTLAPGFSMIANPLESTRTVAEVFNGWPDGTTLSKFDTRLFRLTENAVKFGKWTNPSEILMPGEGAIFYNPTSDYKSVSFVGEVMQGNLSIPIPGGFSVRSSMLPLPGHLGEDLGFPVADGDVIHLFDRDRQKYVLYPYEEGKWTDGSPVVSVGESFWVAKTEPGNWTLEFAVAP
jgi:hypothetical protein